MEKLDMYINIRKIREIRGYTREYMADELNMTVSGYSKIERGEVDVSISKFFKLAEALGVDMVQLFYMEMTELIQPWQQKEQHGLSTDDEKLRLYGNQQKYIALLEKEIDRLNQIIENLRKE